MHDVVVGSFLLAEYGKSGPVVCALDGWYASEKTIFLEHTLIVKYLDENPEILAA